MEFTATAVLSIVLPNKTRKPDVFLRSCSIVGGGGGGGGGGAKMLGKLSVPGVLLIWIIVGQGPTAGT